MRAKIYTVLFAFICLTYYALLIEPSMIITKQNSFYNSTNTDLTTNLRIVQFSDTHLNNKNDIRKLKTIVKSINRMKPDFVVFTGDLISDIRKFGYEKDVINLLNGIKAKRGKLAIYGNHDHGGYFTEQYEKVLNESNFILLKNEEKSFYFENQKVSFIGLDDYMLGKRNYENILNRIQKNTYTIVLAHEPDIANVTKNYPINLQLSGHSHGGQIYLPFFKSLIMPPFAKVYNRGKYKISEKYNSYLIVSNGIGTTKLPIRFLTPPEIISIEIKRTH